MRYFILFFLLLVAGFFLLIDILGLVAKNRETEIPNCFSSNPNFEILVSDIGKIESMAFDFEGRLLFTDYSNSSLNRMDDRRTKSITKVSDNLVNPGGIVVLNSSEALVGVGNGLFGILPFLEQAGIARVNLLNGVVSPFVKNLSMANGIVRTSDGVIYASDDFANSLDRVLPDNTVLRGWKPILGNGMVLSVDEKILYINKSIPAEILALNLRSNQEKIILKMPKSRRFSFLDGLDRDTYGFLYATGYLSGEVFRFDTKSGLVCTLSSGLDRPAALVVGRKGQGFDESSIYVGTHSGRIYEIPYIFQSKTR